MCNNFNDGLTYFPFSLFCFESCDSICLYIIFLEVARHLSDFRKIACRSEAVRSRSLAKSPVYVKRVHHGNQLYFYAFTATPSRTVNL